MTEYYTHDMLWYDVRSVFTSGGTTSYSDPTWTIVYARPRGLAKMAGEDTGPSLNLSPLPKQYAVGNYPNPFNPSTTIQFDLPQASFVRLGVFDVLGRVVAVLVEEEKPAGSHTLRFEGSNLPSGIYLYRIEAGRFVDTRRMVLLK